MKKSLILKITVLAIAVIFVISFLFHLIYFEKFNKNIRPITDIEKQKVMEILNKSMDINEYQMVFGNVYVTKHKELAQIELIKNNSKRGYFVDIEAGKLIKK